MKNPYIAKRHWEFEEASLSKTNEMVKRYDDIIDLSIGVRIILQIKELFPLCMRQE